MQQRCTRSGSQKVSLDTPDFHAYQEQIQDEPSESGHVPGVDEDETCIMEVSSGPALECTDAAYRRHIQDCPPWTGSMTMTEEVEQVSGSQSVSQPLTGPEYQAETLQIRPVVVRPPPGFKPPIPKPRTSLGQSSACLLYTSPSPRDRTRSRMPSSA